MLAIARAMMGRPTVLLLDEPSMGLSPLLTDVIFDAIKEINATGVTVVVVEQNAQLALSIADRGYVMQTGRIVLTDSAAALTSAVLSCVVLRVCARMRPSGETPMKA